MKPLTLVVGAPGVGKTTLLRLVRSAWTLTLDHADVAATRDPILSGPYAELAWRPPSGPAADHMLLSAGVYWDRGAAYTDPTERYLGARAAAVLGEHQGRVEVVARDITLSTHHMTELGTSPRTATPTEIRMVDADGDILGPIARGRAYAWIHEVLHQGAGAAPLAVRPFGADPWGTGSMRGPGEWPDLDAVERFLNEGLPRQNVPPYPEWYQMVDPILAWCQLADDDEPSPELMAIVADAIMMGMPCRMAAEQHWTVSVSSWRQLCTKTPLAK